MSYRNKVIAAALLSFASLAPVSFASAADLPYKVKAKPVPDVPFFFVIDDRVTYSWMPKGTDPGAYSFRPDGSTNAIRFQRLKSKLGNKSNASSEVEFHGAYALPIGAGVDSAIFNPKTMETYSAQVDGTLTVIKEKSPTSFEVEQNLQTMNGARTITFDSKTNHILTMSQERGPAPPPPPGGGRGPQGTAVPGSFTILMISK